MAANSPPLALTSLGSISEQTIGGAIATSTHGSGYNFASVSSACLELGIIVPQPAEQGGIQVVTCNREQNVELFNASLCSLGCTGFIYSVKMKLEPAFRLRHLVEEVEFDWIFGGKTGAPATEALLEDEDGGVKMQQHQSSSRGAVGEATMASIGMSSPESEVNRTYGAPRKARQSIGKLLARGKPLPPLNPRYYPSTRQTDPADIYPCRAPDTEDTARVSPDGWTDAEDDDETRAAQSKINAIIQSSQHTRLWWFPHVKMVTLSRADRTLEPAAGPTFSQRAYHSIVGYHFTQFLLFVSRYHSALPGQVAKVVHYLTHPSFPVEHRGEQTGSISNAEDSLPPATSHESQSGSLASEFEGFKAAPPAPLSPSPAGSLKPLQAHHPHSLTVDHSINVFNMDCLFKQYTSEWAIPYTHTAACLRAMRDWLEEEARLDTGERIHFPIEVRWTDADGIWLSHGYGRRNCYIGIIQFRPYNLPTRYRSLFAKFETLMRHFAGRPHWAKTHTCGPQELARLYPHLDDFLKVRQRYDPDGVLLNPYVRRHLLGEIGEEMSVRRFKKRERGKL